ncbi:MAG TPA: glycosyltransferase family 2 protein [Gemmataceae bacterium]|nr:glycosyltransferase family 2 protein [Gemmataceae bacterium]
MTALLVRERPAPPAAAPFISVILPVRNEEGCVGRTLGQLLAQDYPPDRFEVLVADGRSTDSTRAVVRTVAARHPNVRLLDNPRRWSSAGRNAAVRAARGDVAVLIDGHCELDNSHYLADLARAFQQSGADCVGRPQPLDVAGASPLRRAIAAARSSPLGHNPASFIYSSDEGFVRPQSVAVAYRREVFDRVGLFDESFDACEDVEFNHRVERAGLVCFFTPRVAVRYHPRGTLAGLFRQMARYGRGRVRLLRKHPETFSAGCFVPAAFLLGLVAGPAAALLSPWLAAAYAGAVGVYLLAVILASLCLTVKTRDARLLPWLPAVFVAIHLGAGAGILLEAVAGARREVRRA